MRLLSSAREQDDSSSVLRLAPGDDLSVLERVEAPVDTVIFFGPFRDALNPQVFEALDAAIKPGGRAIFATDELAPDQLDALAQAGWIARQQSTYFAATRRKVWSFRYPGSAPELHSKSGVKTRTSFKVSSTKATYLLYGPFCQLPAGDWLATLLVRGAEGRCVMEISGGADVFASRPVELSEVVDGRIELLFALDEAQAAVEVRLFSDDAPVALEILQLEITPAF